ncbi:hypothetical protein ACLB2K_003601 [Fragaria x ananassa]
MVDPVNKIFNELYVVFKDLIKKNIRFKGKLKGIEAKLEALKPVIGDMVQRNEVLDRPRNELERLTEVMESGIKLFVKCSKYRVWWVFKKYKYDNKLTEWENSLGSELVMLNVYTGRDVKDIAIDVKENAAVQKETGLTRIEHTFEGTEDEAFQGWGGGSMLVVTAPGGSGKTTLAKMLYHDQEVKDKFTKTIFVKVSKKSNYIVVQELYQELESQESEFPNEDGAFSWLKEFLETFQNPLLLILDDVWSESESLLEKFNELSIQSSFSILQPAGVIRAIMFQKIFRTSLDALDEKDQNLNECFLDLGAFPEDQRIPAVALIDMWAELYAIDEDFISIQYLQELSSRSLVNLVVTRKEKMVADGYYSEHFVSQHDVLRNLAIFQAKLDPNKKRLILDKYGSKVPKKLTEQKHQFQTRILSISSDEMFSTDMHKIQLSDVEVLVLSFTADNYALPEFVAEMKNLKVLIVTNHGSLPAKLSNFQLLNSLPNLKRSD